MPYTSLSIASVWIVTFGLLASTLMIGPSGPWLLVTVVGALVAPALLRRATPPSRGLR
ncbi:MAG: hypothetical protein AB7N65_07780 [Vicinamibacterales bacterium]